MWRRRRGPSDSIHSYTYTHTYLRVQLLLPVINKYQYIPRESTTTFRASRLYFSSFRSPSSTKNSPQPRPFCGLFVTHIAANVRACPVYKTSLYAGLSSSLSYSLYLSSLPSSRFCQSEDRPGVLPSRQFFCRPTKESRAALVPDDKSKTRRVNSSEQITRRLNGDNGHNV